MTNQLAYAIYKHLKKVAKKKNRKILDGAIVHESEAYYHEESGEVRQDVYTWGKVKAMAREYRETLRKPNQLIKVHFTE